MHFKSTLGRSVAAAAGAVVLAAVGSTTASAATPRNGICESGEVCFYYLTSTSGSLSDFTTSLDNYGSTQPGCYEFKSAGTGQGVCLKNNASSARNLSSRTVRVYVNSYYGGSYQDLPPGFVGNLGVVNNNNASHKFL